MGRILEDPAAEAQAREAGGDFEQRIVHRATAMHAGWKHAEAWDRIRQAQGWVLAAAVLMALLTGISAAAAVFRDQSMVNIVWALATLLGLQLIMLVLWCLLILVRPAVSGGGGLGRAFMTGAHALGRRLYRGHETTVTLAAIFGLLRRDGLGRWIASLITHGLWTAFCVGALSWSTFELSVRQYDFAWGTTLLSEGTFVTLITVLGAPAEALGWLTPDAELVRASRLGAEVPAGREQWSALLLSVLLLYGLLPRLLLSILSVALATRAARRLRLDTTLPGYARLSDRLAARAHSIGVVDPQPPDVRDASAPTTLRPGPIQGPILLIGLELERGEEGWPPRLPGIEWFTLGRADDRIQRQDVLSALRFQARPPGVVLVICSLARTPDRGAESFLVSVREVARAPVWAVLDEGDVLQMRGGDRAERACQWRERVGRAGLDYVLEANLDDARHPGSRELMALMGQKDTPA